MQVLSSPDYNNQWDDFSLVKAASDNLVSGNVLPDTNKEQRIRIGANTSSWYLLPHRLAHEAPADAGNT